MSREIKFRGYNKDCKMWFYGFLFIESERYFIRQVNDEDLQKKFGKAYFDMIVEKESVGQFTGLKDKNGKEIYEGDILKWIIVEGIEIKKNMGNYEVTFIKGKFTTIKPNIPIGHFETKNIEVIGNIKENPELLEEESNGN